eukprot:SAG31_NODE_23779_length_496_cov_0.654912_1_plen_96_part_10
MRSLGPSLSSNCTALGSTRCIYSKDNPPPSGLTHPARGGYEKGRVSARRATIERAAVMEATSAALLRTWGDGQAAGAAHGPVLGLAASPLVHSLIQ